MMVEEKLYYEAESALENGKIRGSVRVVRRLLQKEIAQVSSRIRIYAGLLALALLISGLLLAPKALRVPYLEDWVAELRSKSSDLFVSQQFLEHDLRELEKQVDQQWDLVLAWRNQDPRETTRVEEEVANPTPAPTPVPVSADCIPSGEVETLRYVFYDEAEFPIPVGEQVEFVPVCGSDQLSVNWEERLGYGVVNHYFVLQGVELRFFRYENPGIDSFSVGYPPEVGDVGMVETYADRRSQDDDGYGYPDGVVDSVWFKQLREWTPLEEELARLAVKFYSESVDEEWMYFIPGTESSRNYKLDGEDLRPGPYGRTYYVPAEGGNLSSSDPETGVVLWSAEVYPGDNVFAGYDGAEIEALSRFDPWYFCNMFERTRPVWSPQELPIEMWGVCDGLYEQSDDSIQAVLARAGYLAADTKATVDRSENWRAFVRWGLQHTEEIELPAHEWVEVDSIELDAVDSYTVTVDKDNGYPVFSQLSAEVADYTYASDVAWYTPGTLLVFVRRNALDNRLFDWKDEDIAVFRVQMVEGKAVVERAGWIVK